MEVTKAEGYYIEQPRIKVLYNKKTKGFEIGFASEVEENIFKIQSEICLNKKEFENYIEKFMIAVNDYENDMGEKFFDLTDNE